VRPTWADSFFLDRNPKTIELRKGSFGTSLKAGDSIVIYATLPVGEAIGTVKVVRRELLTVDRLWQESQQGQLAKVSRQQFETYYTNQESGVGVRVGGAKLFPCQIALYQLRQNWGHRWQPPQQMQQLTHEQMAAVSIAHARQRLRYVVMNDLATWRD
jgi:predicted transcriptional regulator